MGNEDTNLIREHQKESWWKDKLCPMAFVLPNNTDMIRVYNCIGSDCAMWLETRIDKDGEKIGVCTKS